MPTIEEEKIYQIALSIIPKIGVINARRLMSYMGSARDIFKSTRSQLLKIPQIGPILAAAIHQSGLVVQAESIWMDCQREHTQILFYTDLDFPNRLKQIFDSPIVLYSPKFLGKVTATVRFGPKLYPDMCVL
jgi:DNA processing protein